MNMKIDILLDAIEKKDAPVCVGLDPMLSYIPSHIVRQSVAENGEGLKAGAYAIWEYNKRLIDALCDIIPAVKPQVAMYEQFGYYGMEVFEKTVRYCHEKGLVVIGDVKRGDIGSTSEAYARAHLGSVKIGNSFYSPFDEDFATVNPYLGDDGIEPFTKVCKETGKGIFILVKTSNPSGSQFQDLNTEGKKLYERVADMVNKTGKDLMSVKYPYSSVGAVVGATYPEVGGALRKIMPNALLLVPGYGAQGASAKDLREYFNRDGLGAVVNSSRGIICAWKKEDDVEYAADNFAECARKAASAMISDINSAR